MMQTIGWVFCLVSGITGIAFALYFSAAAFVAIYGALVNRWSEARDLMAIRKWGRVWLCQVERAGWSRDKFPRVFADALRDEFNMTAVLVPKSCQEEFARLVHAQPWWCDLKVFPAKDTEAREVQG